MYIYVHILTRIHTCKLTYIHTYKDTYVHIYNRTCTYAHIHKYTPTIVPGGSVLWCICMLQNIWTVPTTGRAGTITAVLGEGALASVRWDSTPNEEHQYRCGRFGRFELVRATFLLHSQPMQLYAQILQEWTYYLDFLTTTLCIFESFLNNHTCAWVHMGRGHGRCRRCTRIHSTHTNSHIHIHIHIHTHTKTFATANVRRARHSAIAGIADARQPQNKHEERTWKRQRPKYRRWRHASSFAQ